MNLRRTTLSWAFLFPGIVCAAVAEPMITLSDLGHGAYELNGYFNVKAPQDVIWSVLTDYEGIPRFVDSMKASRIVEKDHDHVLVEQKAVGRLFWFSKEVRVMLRIHETRMSQIHFEDMARQDFTYYKGSWEIQSEAGSQKVQYRLACHRRFKIPNSLARKVMKRDAENLLAQVQKEIIRRTEGVSQ